MSLFKQPILSPEDRKILEEAKERVAIETERIERDRRLYKVLVEDPVDFDSLVRIGKRVGATRLEIINALGSIVRFDFRDNSTEVTSRAEEEATKGGYW
jgi:hypothetical protein